jgi:hypothetical protein
MGFDRDLVGDKVAGPLRSLFALLAINQALDAYPPAFLKAQGLNILLTTELIVLGHPVSGTVIVQKPEGWVILASSYLFCTRCFCQIMAFQITRQQVQNVNLFNYLRMSPII